MSRTTSWLDAVRELREDRAPRSEIREERLRTTAGLRGTPALALSTWRGRSGRRYVVGIYAIDADHSDIGACVCLAVTRDEGGIAVPLMVEAFDDASDLSGFLRIAKARGADELHVHRLAETADERAAVVRDLDVREVEAA